MKAALLHGPHEDFRIEEWPKPEPEPGSAIVRVRAAGVCGSELDFVEGIFSLNPCPLILGHEIAGEIAESGPGLDYKEGDRVAVHNMMGCGLCRNCRQGWENLCENPRGQLGFTAHGGFAQYVKVPATNLVRLPEQIDYPTGAVLGCSGLTAVHATRLATIDLGETAVVNGVGGVGLSVLQMANLRGARTIAIADKPWKAHLAREMGADEALVVQDYQDVAAWVRDLTEGGADVYFDLVGTSVSMGAGIDCLRHRGRFIIIGYQKDSLIVSPVSLLKREIQIRSSVAGCRRDLEAAVDYAARGKLKVIIDSTLPLESINDCISRLQNREVRGRNVLLP